ncbi:MerR family transcriptional regulator [Streptomyces sp. NPDC048106]|uniref:MerR family transcriptional regulator n=1 Tax=Streptomyces sp. NPDC048106 TaxID=3155750 RepID=UPI003456A196
MRIGELSEATGASARSLRYYEQQGLLTSTRGPNGYREYEPEAIEAVLQIKALLDVGLPTEAIRDVLPCNGVGGRDPEVCPALQERISGLRDRLARQAEELTRTSRGLTSYLERNFA